MTDQVTIVGAGLMGQGIAAVFARAGYRIVLHDTEDVLTTSVRRTRERLDAMGAATPAAEITATPDLPQAVADADVVVEAVTEDLAVKAEVLGGIDSAAAAGTIVATNTSALPLDVLRDNLGPDRPFLATHFFNPAEIVPGVEVAAVDELGDRAAQQLMELLAGAGKRPVRVAPSPGFIGNRLQLALFREAERCVAEGLASPADIDTVVRSTFGFRLPAYGPFHIADMAGLQVYASIMETLHDAFGDRFDLPQSLRERNESGNLGLKSGAGYFEYSPAEQKRIVEERDATYRALLGPVSD